MDFMQCSMVFSISHSASLLGLGKSLIFISPLPDYWIFYIFFGLSNHWWHLHFPLHIFSGPQLLIFPVLSQVNVNFNFGCHHFILLLLINENIYCHSNLWHRSQFNNVLLQIFIKNVNPSSREPVYGLAPCNI